MFAAIERFILDVVEEYRENSRFPQMEAPGIHRKHVNSKVKHHIYSAFEKSIIIEMECNIKDITNESFDDYFPGRKKKKCKLKYILIG